MAKKKRATALFDVISQSKRYQRPAMAKPSGGPSWWPFGRRRVTPLVSVAEIHSSVMPQAVAEPEPAVAPARAARAQASPRMAVYREAAEESHEAEAPSRLAYASAPVRSAAPLPTVEDPLHKSLHVAVDPERKVIAFRMNYTVAIVGGFAVLVAVGLAVAVGQHMRGGDTAPLLTPSIQKLQAGPAHPEFLGTGKKTAVTAGYAGATGGDASSPASQQAARTAKPKPTFNEPRENHFTATVVDGKRQIGLNYVVIQMYASSEEKMAQEACEFLKQHGVPCTIEKGIKGWPPSAFVLVGTQGFDRISTKEFKEYLAQIEALSTQFTTPPKGTNQGTPKASYKAFQPSPKKWDKVG